MTTTPLAGASASASVAMTGVTASLSVEPRPDGDIPCTLTCNDQTVVVIFKADGNVDLDVIETPQA
jgi:hypothetical protein